MAHLNLAIPLEQELGKQIYNALCQDEMKRLAIKVKVDFYVTGDSDLNAFSLTADGERDFWITAQ